MAKRIPGRGETLAYYNKIVGTGEKASEDLTREEAREAMDLILRGKATPAQTGGFLMALRMKGEAAPEHAGFTEAARARLRPVPGPPGVLDTADYAGRTTQPFLSLAADFIAASAGVAIVRHGNGSAPAFAGRRSMFDTLRALRVHTGPRPGKMLQFVHITEFAPEVHSLLELRKELGVRSAMHTVARMLNPSGARSHLLGISHRPYLEKMARALADLGAERALIVDGVSGSEELPPDSGSLVCELRHGELRTHRLGPEEHGLPRGSLDLKITGAAGDAALIEQVLQGKTAGPPRNAALMNAALRLYAAGKTEDPKEALRMSEEALASGRARKLLEEMRR
ncbi:MAG: anthranilate phosphoribosyltransferase [Euryarchaeota archaeon]|nr:anthranilate phosphoribosyltransferase [Euryarchaeota archaeon]